MQGRIPMNAQRDFFNALLQEYFDKQDVAAAKLAKKTPAEHRATLEEFASKMTFKQEGT